MKIQSKPQTFQEMGSNINKKKGSKVRAQKQISSQFSKTAQNQEQIQCSNESLDDQSGDIDINCWNNDQLRHLFLLYDEHGSRWSSIQKQMPNRTQMKIKNHFYGVLRGITRFLLRYFREVRTNQTKISNKLTPSSLQLIYKGSEQFSYLEGLIRRAIEAMGFRFNKHKLATFIKRNQEQFRKLASQILDIVNKADQPSKQQKIGNTQDNECSVQVGSDLLQTRLESNMIKDVAFPASVYALPLYYCNYGESFLQRTPQFFPPTRFQMVPFIYEQPKLSYFQMGPICAEQKHYFDAQI